MPKKVGSKTGSEWAAWTLKARGIADLSQEDFAALVGVSRGTVADWERGANPPELKSVQAIVRAVPGAPPPPHNIGIAQPAAITRMSDPAGKVASVRTKLEAALDRRAHSLSPAKALAVQRELTQSDLPARLSGDPLTDAGADVLIDLLVRLVGG